MASIGPRSAVLLGISQIRYSLDEGSSVKRIGMAVFKSGSGGRSRSKAVRKLVDTSICANAFKNALELFFARTKILT